MPSSNICWGIEIGAGAIKALKLEQSAGELNVLDVAVIPHKKVLSTPDLDQDDATRLALGTLASQYDLSGASVAMSVPGHMAFARFAKLPPVEPKKVPDIVKFEAVQQIPFPIEDVEWDFQTFVSPDSPEVEVGIFAITRERMMERLHMYADVHLVPDLITLSPVAVYNAIAYDLGFDESTPGTILLDIGTTSTDLVVAEAGRVWIRTFPVGGHHFTEALVEAFKLSYSKAEKLKKEAEQSKHARHVFQAMRPIFTDLAQDVQRSIGYYESLHPDADLKRLIGMGSTFRLPGLRKYLKQQLQMDVYRLEQFKALSIDGPQAGEFQAATLNLATAYGLALQGLKREGSAVSLATLEANLMPTPVLRTTMWKRKTKWFGVAAACAALAGGAMFIRPFFDDQEVKANKPAASIAQALRLGNDLKEQARPATQSDSVDYTAANMIELLKSRGVYAHLVNDLGLMFNHAQARVPTWTSDEGESRPEDLAFSLRTYDTDYVGPKVASTGGRGGRGGRGQEEEVETTPDDPKIEVTLRATTTQPDPQKFMLATLESWLRENAERPGVPYTIEFEDGSLTWEVVMGEIDAASPTLSGSRASARPSGPREYGGLSSEIDPRAYEGGGHEGGGHEGGGGFSRPSVIGIQQPAAQPRRQAPRGGGSIDRIAPLPEEPAFADAGTGIATFTLSWTVVILPEQSETGGES